MSARRVLAIGLLLLAIGLWLAGLLYCIASNWLGGVLYVLAGLIAMAFSMVAEKV
jgi:hypothetical protein